MKVSIVLEALTGAFITDTDRASKQFQRRMKDMERNAKIAGAAIGAALVTGATAVGVAIKQAIDHADELNDLSKKIGIPTDVLSQLQYAAKLSGVAAEQLQGGLVKMVKFQAEAAKGAKENVKVFDVLRISIKDAGGHLRDTRAVFEDFANVFANIEDGPEKTALALKVFGKSGADLIPLLDEGRAGIQGMADELDRLGGTVAPETARAADEFNDQIEALKTQVAGLALSVAADLLPDMIDLVSEFRNATGTGEDLKNTAHEIANAIREIATAAAWSGEKIQQLAYYMGELNKTNPTYILGRFLSGNNPQANPFSLPTDAPAGAHAVPMGSAQGRGGHGAAGSSFVPSLKGLFAPPPKTGGGGQKKQVDEVAEAYKRMNAQMTEQIALFGKTTEVAQVRYEIEHGLLARDTEEHKKILLAQAATLDLMKADAEETERRNKVEQERLDTIKEAHESLSDTLSDMQFEIDLLGKSNAERIAEIELRRIGIGLSDEEREDARVRLTALAEEMDAMHERVAAMDDLRGSMADFIAETDFSADSFKDFGDTVVQQLKRIAAEWLTTQLLGQQGTTGGGWLSGLFGMFSGGGSGASTGGSLAATLDTSFGNWPGFAGGGDPPVGQPYWVGEHGPELRIDRTPSTIVPNHELAGVGGFTQINNFPVVGRIDNRSRMQIAQAGESAGRMAARRNGR